MLRFVSTLLTATLGLALCACGAVDAKLDSDDIENHCAVISEKFSGDLFYDENAADPSAVIPDRLAALEDLREQSKELKTDGGEPASREWLTALDEVIATVDEIVNWPHGPGSDLAFAMTFAIHEDQIDELATAAAEGGLGQECSDIDDWKFFPAHDTNA